MKSRSLLLVVIGFIVLIAVLTNPNQARHKEVLKNKLSSYVQNSIQEDIGEPDDIWEQAGQGIGLLFGGVIVDKLIDNVLSTNNYVVFSTTKINWGAKSKVIGFGVFGNVFITGELKEVLNSYEESESTPKRLVEDTYDNFLDIGDSFRDKTFEKIVEAKYNPVIHRLEDIRRAQDAYKSVFGCYTGDWDTLIGFVKTGTLPIVKKIGMLTDSMIEAGWTEETAIKKGRIIRDTLFVSIQDTLFGNGFNAEDLKVVPGTYPVVEFHLGATIITNEFGVAIPIFEAKAHNNTILKGLDRQSVINLNDKARSSGKYPGLKIGSLIEDNDSKGNWQESD